MTMTYSPQPSDAQRVTLNRSDIPHDALECAVQWALKDGCSQTSSVGWFLQCFGWYPRPYPLVDTDSNMQWLENHQHWDALAAMLMEAGFVVDDAICGWRKKHVKGQVMTSVNHDSITHALSQDARDYLTKVFECTTFQHLMRLGEPSSNIDLNVFDENVKYNPSDDTHLDQEIGAYILAVKENREPYDPAEHEFDARIVDSGYELFVRGVATADEWESLCVVEDDKRACTETMRENLFNQLIAPRRDCQTYYPDPEPEPEPEPEPSAEPAALRFEDKVVQAWQDDNGDIQVRVIDNADALTTRITISGGGVERLWHPGSDGDDDDPQEVLLVPKKWPAS